MYILGSEAKLRNSKSASRKMFIIMIQAVKPKNGAYCTNGGVETILRYMDGVLMQKIV